MTKPLFLRLFFPALSLGLFLVGCQSATDNKLENVKKAGELVVLTRNSPTTYYQGPDGPLGIEYDMTKAFADHLGVKLKMVAPERFSDIIVMLTRQEADMAAAGLTVTKARKRIIRFAPPYQEIRQQLVYRQGTKAPTSVADLTDANIEVTAGTSYTDRLQQLKHRHPKLGWRETNKKSAEQLLQMVSEGLLEYTVADSNIVSVARQHYPELRVAFDIQIPESLAWAFPLSKDKSFYREAATFIRRLRRSGEIRVLLERYYGATDANYFNITLYQLRIKNRLPNYQLMFERASEKYGIDWRLLAAISYQESYWNPKAISRTGVRGMMMLTENTAAQLGIIDRLDPKQSVDGGARYIRQLIDKMPKGITKPDRIWMALAAYNVGYYHLVDARDITRRQKGNPNKWNDVKQRLPLLSRQAYYSKTRYGYARGNEPVRFVSRIRHYYDVLVKIDEEQKSQRRNDAIDLVAPII